MTLDREAGRLRRQLEDGLRTAIRDGVLHAGAGLPSTRALAAQLGVSRRLVVECYGQLTAEGYLVAMPRSRTAVSDLAAPPRAATASPAPSRARHDLRPGTPDLAGFPRAAWRRAAGAVLRSAPDDVLRYPDPRGAPELRAALADYLRRVRGVVCEPDHVIVCGGVRDALSLLAGVLSRARAEIAVEDPGLFERAEIIAAAGGRVHGVAVDDEGLRTCELLASPAAAVFVTPAHQFPTGVPLSAARRGELIMWARRGGLIIEDDYDAEFRFDQPPLRALQGLAPDHVVYIGSTSKTLAPALRLGWLVAPARLVEPLAEAKRLRDGGEPVLPQLTVAELLRTGAYDRHLRAARTRYRDRRAALLAALRRHLPNAEVHGMAAGLHTLIALPATVDVEALHRAAERRRLAISSIDDYCLRERADDRRLVVGFANLDAAAAEAAVRQLAAAIADAQEGGAS